jgi:hypothetical protein
VSDEVRHYLVYGWKRGTVDEVASILEPILGIEFMQRVSYYWGEYSTAGELGKENFEVKPNVDGEGELIEPDHPAYATLLYVNETPRPDAIPQILEAVEGAEFLSSDEVRDSPAGDMPGTT